MISDVRTKKCVPCEGNVPPLSPEQTAEYLQQVAGWSISEGGLTIFREYTFKDFEETIAFVNKIAQVAESEGHHPDLQVSYGKIRVELTTHAIGGLSENDFIVAAKIDDLSK